MYFYAKVLHIIKQNDQLIKCGQNVTFYHEVDDFILTLLSIIMKH